MDHLGVYLFAHPFWVWLAIGAVFLAVELATGSGWLLWPAGSAAIVAVVALFARLGWPIEVVLFAVLTIATTILGRRFMPRSLNSGPDINDPASRLVGHHGETAVAFDHGAGRVFVDGKEWAAEIDGDGALAAGDKIRVTAVLGGARLKVKPA